MSAIGSTKPGASDSTLIRLRFGGREIVLSPGRYTVGRVPTCEIVIDEPLVSRHHAELNVGHDSAVIRDLESVNGVYVNGKIIAGSCILSHGDRIGIGKQELEFHIGSGTTDERQGLTQVNLTGAPDSAVVYQVRRATPSSKPPPPSSEPTQQVDALELMGAVADRAMGAGRFKHAEDILRLHLARVLDGCKTGRPVADATASTAVRLALQLAVGTGSGKWVDYATELLTIRRAILEPALVTTLSNAVDRVPAIDVARLEQYLKSLRSHQASLPHLKLAQELEQLVTKAKLKRA